MRQPCAHRDAVPVTLNTGELVAALCPSCDAQLPARWLGCSHENAIDTPMLGQRPGQFLCNDCGGSGWRPTGAGEGMRA